MELLVLYDNYSHHRSLKFGWGFSCLIDGRILFDTGEKGESLLFNMKALKVHIPSIKTVVLSHEHWDHTGGLWDVLKLRRGLPVVACPSFSRDFKNKVQQAGGVLHLPKGPEQIDSGFFVTGEIRGDHRGQPIPEQALIVQTKRGISVITGCAHPGLFAILDAVNSLFPGLPVSCLLGGFHLKGKPREELQTIAQEVKARRVERAGPTHCSGDEARVVFREIFGRNFIDVRVGSRIAL